MISVMGFRHPEIASQSDNTDALRLFNPSGFQLPVKKQNLRLILNTVESEENVKFSLVEVVFVNQNEIIRLNKEYLDRDYVTDIITFRYDEVDIGSTAIEGTMYCCAPRIAEQSAEYYSAQDEEFYRIFIHGLLHLVGYNDHDDTEKEKMKEKENHYLAQLKTT